MKRNIQLVPGEEVLDLIPATEIQSIELTERGRLVRTKGGNLWLTTVKHQFEIKDLEMILRGHFQQMVEVCSIVRKRTYRPAVTC